MAVRAHMEKAKLQEYIPEFVESLTIHPATCLFPVSNASKQVQLHPEAALILPFLCCLDNATS